MKKMIFAAVSAAMILSACATSTSNTASNPTQQLGVAALKVAVNAKCLTEINNVTAWKNATKVMTVEQRESIQTEVCGCVSEKAPTSVTSIELATAAIDPAARATIVNQVVTKTVNACVAETLKKA